MPTSFELNLWQGRAWVGLVPFRMEATRPSWLPRRAALDFLETNLRTYVHRNGEPGVFFFSLEASSWLAVRAARLMWGLPYQHAEMHAERDEDRVVYHSGRIDDERAPRLDVTYDIGEELGPSAVGTLEHFLLERYYLFVEKRGRPLKGQVHHTPYPARRAKTSRFTTSSSPPQAFRRAGSKRFTTPRASRSRCSAHSTAELAVRPSIGMHALRTRLLAANVGFAVALISPLSFGDEPDKARCAAAYERAQELQRTDALAAARKQLVVCSETCPGRLRRDCLAWINDVDALMPTIVLRPRDANGQPIRQLASPSTESYSSRRSIRRRRCLSTPGPTFFASST